MKPRPWPVTAARAAYVASMAPAKRARRRLVSTRSTANGAATRAVTLTAPARPNAMPEQAARPRVANAKPARTKPARRMSLWTPEMTCTRTRGLAARAALPSVMRCAAATHRSRPRTAMRRNRPTATSRCPCASQATRAGEGEPQRAVRRRGVAPQRRHLGQPGAGQRGRAVLVQVDAGVEELTLTGVRVHVEGAHRWRDQQRQAPQRGGEQQARRARCAAATRRGRARSAPRTTRRRRSPRRRRDGGACRPGNR